MHNNNSTHETGAGVAQRVKIVVCVHGGVVYGVYSNQPYDAVEVLLVDHDDMEAEGIGRDERDEISDRETRCLMEHYVDRPNNALSFDEGEHCENAARELGEAV